MLKLSFYGQYRALLMKGHRFVIISLLQKLCYALGVRTLWTYWVLRVRRLESVYSTSNYTDFCVKTPKSAPSEWDPQLPCSYLIHECIDTWVAQIFLKRTVSRGIMLTSLDESRLNSSLRRISYSWVRSLSKLVYACHGTTVYSCKGCVLVCMWTYKRERIPCILLCSRHQFTNSFC